MNSEKLLLARLLTVVITVCLTVPVTSRAEDLTIGVFLPLSGSNAIIGHMQKNAMLLAVSEVNGRGVISGGRKLALDIRNGGRRLEDTRNIVNHFIRDKQYPLIVSGAGSTEAAEAARWCQRGRTPLVVITGSEDGITRSGFDYVFRIAPPRSHYADAAIEFAREFLRPEKVALIMEESEFGESVMNVIKGVAREERWDIVYETGFVPRNVDLADLNAGLGRTNIDTVFLAAFSPEAPGILKEIRSGGFKEQAIVSLAPSSATETAFTECGEDCRGVFSSALWFEGMDRAADRFSRRYMENYGRRPDYHAAQAYAAILAAASALRNVDPADREAVRDSLRETRIGSPLGGVLFSDWEGFKNQNRPTSFLFQWFSDHFEVVWPERYRTAEPIE